jgi:xanthine dehydrogenase large subunit
MSNLPHDSAHTHVTGQSEFIDDRPKLSNELFVDVLYSPHAKAKIKKINIDKALKSPGVKGIFLGKDFHDNVWGTIFRDQPLLAYTEVNFAGEAIALIAAINPDAAAVAKALIEVSYEIKPAILSIQEALKQESFIAGSRKIERGEVDAELAKATHKLENSLVIRGADHFYLESNVAVAYPKEDGQIEIHSSSQHPTEVQHVVSHGLGLTSKDVTVIVKRMGGGFGGKESQAAPIGAYAALVAQKLNVPARIVLTKDDDMIMTGKRNPFEIFYKVGFDDQGYITALDAKLYSDGGAYADLSTSIMERAMLHSDNAYFIPHLRVTGQVCRTNYHPHTAFRGFGGPKGVAMIEKIIEEVAHRLGKDPLEIRKLNCYSDVGGRNITHYDQVVENNCLPKLLSDLEKESHYVSRRREIDAHNAQALKDASLPLKGLSLTPVKFGISFTTRFLNQANSLVIIHRDGSLQVTTGATEMGQGVNARISEMVASELGLKRSDVRMMPTSTDKNANTSPTAASSGTDLNGAAAMLAVRRIKMRLSELALKLFDIPESKWARHTAGLGTQPEVEVKNSHITNDPNEGAEWNSGIAEYNGVSFNDGEVFLTSHPEKRMTFHSVIVEAYHNRISLSEYAHYKFPGLLFNKLTGKGTAFLYFTQGAACSEVSIDRDTGEAKVTRADIIMDLGRPINEALDIGQVTGAFIQGMGWVTTEKLFYKNGFLLSHAPSTYKIPNIQDTPRVFNVRLLNNNENKPNVRGTKAAGEPPLLLCLSVWTAIHDAMKTLKPYKEKYPTMELPATNEEILKSIHPDLYKKWALKK